MARTAIGIAIGAAFVTAVIWTAFSETKVECEICVEYKGRTACSIARAADVLQAESQALPDHGRSHRNDRMWPNGREPAAL